MMVSTTKGIIDRGLLTVRDIVIEEGNCRVIATEWHLGEELVRRDVYVNILVGLPLGAEQGKA